MIKKLLVFMCLFGFVSFCSANTAVMAEAGGVEVSNGYFAFTMPAETEGTFVVQKNDDGVYICEKNSVKRNQGGFAFEINMYKNPSDYADREDYKKIGELTDKKGTVYDVILVIPREIYYGDGARTAKNYQRLYDFAPKVELIGVNGCEFVKNKGMKGEELYAEILKQYRKTMKKKQLSKLGYAYYDLNDDGKDELFISELCGDSKHFTEVYTTVDRKPVKVISAESKDKYSVCNKEFICKESNSGSGNSCVSILILTRNSTRFQNPVRFIVDTDRNRNKPWFIAYGENDNGDNVTKDVFNYRKGIFDEIKKFTFTPFVKQK